MPRPASKGGADLLPTMNRSIDSLRDRGLREPKSGLGELVSTDDRVPAAMPVGTPRSCSDRLVVPVMGACRVEAVLQNNVDDLERSIDEAHRHGQFRNTPPSIVDREP